MKLNKDKFLKSELGSSLKECVTAWDKWLDELRKYPWGTEEYKRERKAAEWCQAQWEVYQMAVKQFYGVEYHFSRTDEYFGVCTDDESDWLFKVNRAECIRVLNKYVLSESLEENELETILRDEAFRKAAYFSKSKFSHDKFAEHIKAQYHVKKINGLLHIYEGGIYVPGYEAIERAMLKEISSLTSNQRNEVLKYLNVVCVEEEYRADLHLIV